MKSVVAAFAVAAGLAAFACSSPEAASPPADPPVAMETPARAAAIAGPAHPEALHNFAQVAPGLWRAAAPEGDAAFAELARNGVSVVLTVDGARPDVEAAARYGIRYVHVPIEYSGMTREQELRIAKVAVEAKEKGEGLMVHCHHGKHRGPAACGVAWISQSGVEGEQGVAMMKKAGADPKYVGLYESVLGFRPFSAEELATVKPEDLPSAASVPGLVDAMVGVDDTWVRMGAVKKAAWGVPADMPDVKPSHEARILAERFRETARLKEVVSKPEKFRALLSESEKAAWDLEKALASKDAAAAGAAYDRVAASCASCHKAYRDNTLNSK